MECERQILRMLFAQHMQILEPYQARLIVKDTAGGAHGETQAAVFHRMGPVFRGILAANAVKSTTKSSVYHPWGTREPQNRAQIQEPAKPTLLEKLFVTTRD